MSVATAILSEVPSKTLKPADAMVPPALSLKLTCCPSERVLLENTEDDTSAVGLTLPGFVILEIAPPKVLLPTSLSANVPGSDSYCFVKVVRKGSLIDIDGSY